MRSRNSIAVLALAGVAAVALAIPAIGQNAPESILPPGFGEPAAPPPKGRDEGRPPADLLPGDPGAASPGAPATAVVDANGDLLPDDPGETGEGDEEEEEEQAEGLVLLPDLPPGVRRSTARVGVLEETDGGLGEEAFGTADGRYLSHLLRHTEAPIASRWMSILLRRTLLSDARTPASINGADWAAERAWLLLRMGEADAARQLVQKVDVDRYTPKMFDVAMQAALATSDPAGLCPMVEPASAVKRDPAWPFAAAMCAALAGDSADASARIGAARSRGPGAGIDGVLAEKVVGAGSNTRRAVTVEWEGTSQLTAWRYGLATATAAEIPERLLLSANPRVRAWHARAPLLSPAARLSSADIAAAMGVFSSTALVDFYGAVADLADSSEIAGTPPDQLRLAYAAEDIDGRIEALRGLWATGPDGDPYARYARLVLTARAAARIPAEDSYLAEAGELLAAMFAAGLDVQAARWSGLVGADPQSLGWALLAVGAPGQAVQWTPGASAFFAANQEGGARGALFVAAIAGLNRLPIEAAQELARDGGFVLTRDDRWTRALDRAVAAREPGTVAILCAIGLQGERWSAVSPARLYHAVSALRRAGFAAEARMIAAEAVTRG